MGHMKTGKAVDKIKFVTKIIVHYDTSKKK